MEIYRTKKAMQLGIRIQPSLYKRFKELCYKLDYDISKRLRYLIEKDIKNMEKLVYLKRKQQNKEE